MPIVNLPFPIASQDHRRVDAAATPTRRPMQAPSVTRDAGVVLALAMLVAVADKLFS